MTRSVTVSLDADREVKFSPFLYRACRPAYAETFHQAQGVVPDRTYLLLETSPSQTVRSEARWLCGGEARIFLERQTTCPADREILARLDRAAAQEHTRLSAGQPEQKPEPERTYKYGLKQ